MPAKTRSLRQEKKKITDLEVANDAVEVAEEAGLRYVSDDQPGYTRKAKGDEFEYFDTDGKRIRDQQRILDQSACDSTGLY